MDNLIDFFKGFNLQEIISLIVVVWFMTHKQFSQIKDDLKSIKDDVKSLDMRLTRLEGRFDERGYWESRREKIEGEK